MGKCREFLVKSLQDFLRTSLVKSKTSLGLPQTSPGLPQAWGSPGEVFGIIGEVLGKSGEVLTGASARGNSLPPRTNIMYYDENRMTIE